MDTNQFYTIILRHDTSTNWMLNNPILQFGEYGVEDDTHRLKRGDGVTSWSDLSYDTFGVEFAVTFENLQGDITDNEQLSEAFENTLKKDSFTNSDNKILTNITFSQKDNIIGQLKKVDQNILTNESTETFINIISDDDSINGIWSTDENGISTLNLRSTTSIDDYKEGVEYKQGQLCIYDNQIIRAKEDLTSTAQIDLDKWIILTQTSLHSEDIKYNPENTSLESTTVQDAITELDTNIQTVEDKVKQLDELIII